MQMAAHLHSMSRLGADSRVNAGAAAKALAVKSDRQEKAKMPSVSFIVRSLFSKYEFAHCRLANQP